MHAQLLLKHQGNKIPNDITQIGKARLEKGFSIADICRMTKLSYDNYIKYEKGIIQEQYMSIEPLKRISNALGKDFLSSYHHFKENSASNVKKYMEEHNLSNRKFAAECSVSITTIKHWRNGTCSPSYEMWQKFFQNK